MGILVGKELGEAMLGVAARAEVVHWHAGQGDPIYAVGSFLLSGRVHYAGVAKLALANVERCAREYDTAADPLALYGWTRKDRRELARIMRGLKHALRHGHFSTNPAGLVSPAWLREHEPTATGASK